VTKQIQGTYDEQYRITRPDGSIRWIRDRAYPIRDDRGKVYRVTGIAADVTQRKEAEDQIQKLNQELEQRVLQRTAQLETANKELEAFSYSVSHDLRAPLRSIDGFSRALLLGHADQLDEKGKHYLARVRGAAQRMEQLIDDLLNLSRVTRGEMRREQVDLGLLRAVARPQDWHSCYIRDVMTANPVTIDAETPISVAATKMLHE
jgi:signal transduction histidine kinase